MDASGNPKNLHFQRKFGGFQLETYQKCIENEDFLIYQTHPIYYLTTYRPLVEDLEQAMTSFHGTLLSHYIAPQGTLYFSREEIYRYRKVLFYCYLYWKIPSYQRPIHHAIKTG
jgi:hypothetical protein